jgi:hypothetical protein
MRRLSSILCVLCLSFAATLAESAPANAAVLIGDQTIGATADGGSAPGSEAFGYTASASGTAGSISVYLDTTGGVTVGLYGAGARSRPGARLAVASNSSNVAHAWATIPLPGSVKINLGGRYWIALGGNGGAISYRDKGNSGSSLDWSGTGFASPYSISQQWNSNPVSAYVSTPSEPPPPPVKPANTVSPALSGTPQQGSTLTASPGTWTGTAPISYTYLWSDGKTGSTDLLDVSDVGQNVSVTVTAANAAGSTPATSASVGPVTGTPPPPGPPVNISRPVISGTAQQGATLTATNGSWTNSPTSYTYQWQDDGTQNIAGATHASYTAQLADVSHTLNVIVTATNAAGGAQAVSVATATVTASSGGGLPPGVTLSPIDGGPNYYGGNGFTYAHNAGWDSPGFFPSGPFYCTMASQFDANIFLDVGWNFCDRTQGDVNLPLMTPNHLWAVVADNGGPETTPLGPETVGLLAADEPACWTGCGQGGNMPFDALSTAPNSQQDGRFWETHTTWNQYVYGPPSATPGGTMQAYLTDLVTTPNGTQRHIDQNESDMYWFNNAYEAQNGSLYTTPYQGGLIYNLTGAGSPPNGEMSPGQMRCGCRYGDQIDWDRGFQTASLPIMAIIEDGNSTADSRSVYITPPEMNWAAWSSIIHGARGISWFDHTFFGPGISNHDLQDTGPASSTYRTVQPGQTISIYNQMKASDGLISQMAPEINSPVANGYVTTNLPVQIPCASTSCIFGANGAPVGIETRATSQGNGQFTIFADLRAAEGSASNISATFKTTDGYTGPVTVVGENRTVQATGGTFADTFATTDTVHIYRIP